MDSPEPSPEQLLPAPSEAGVHELTAATDARDEQRYTVMVPAGLKAGAPLVVALHYGFDPNSPFPPFYGRGVIEGLVGPALGQLEAIIVAPDSHGLRWTDPELTRSVLELTERLADAYQADKRRLVVTGFSLGGIGTWHLASQAPETFSAALSVSARPEPESAATFPDLPLYVVHSAIDEIFPINEVEDAIASVRSRGVAVEYERVDGVTHFNVSGFVEPLRKAVPWLKRQWDDQG